MMLAIASFIGTALAALGVFFVFGLAVTLPFVAWRVFAGTENELEEELP